MERAMWVLKPYVLIHVRLMKCGHTATSFHVGVKKMSVCLNLTDSTKTYQLLVFLFKTWNSLMKHVIVYINCIVFVVTKVMF